MLPCAKLVPPPGTRGSIQGERCILNHPSWEGAKLLTRSCAVSPAKFLFTHFFSASLHKPAKRVHHTSSGRRNNTVLGLGVWLLIPSRAKDEWKRKRKPQPTSTVTPVPLQFKGNGRLEKLNREMGCCLLPAWALDHLQIKARIEWCHHPLDSEISRLWWAYLKPKHRL